MRFADLARLPFQSRASGRNRPAWRAAAAAPCCGSRSCRFRRRCGWNPGARAPRDQGPDPAGFRLPSTPPRTPAPTSSCNSRETHGAPLPAPAPDARKAPAGWLAHGRFLPAASALRASSFRIWTVVNSGQGDAAQQRDGDHRQQTRIAAGRTDRPASRRRALRLLRSTSRCGRRFAAWTCAAAPVPHRRRHSGYLSRSSAVQAKVRSSTLQ